LYFHAIFRGNIFTKRKLGKRETERGGGGGEREREREREEEGRESGFSFAFFLANVFFRLSPLSK